MRPVRPVLLLVSLLATSFLSGCDSFNVEGQQRFEDVAYFGVLDGATADDWQTAPAFGGRMDVTPPAPNPARLDDGTRRGDLVILQVYDARSAGGLLLYRRRDADGVLLRVSAPSSSSVPVTTFQFYTSEVAETTAPGSVRLIVRDASERVVTYGDLVLE